MNNNHITRHCFTTIFFIFLFTGSLAQADLIPIEKDAFIMNKVGKMDQKTGGWHTFRASGSSPEQQGLVQFDLSTLSGNVSSALLTFNILDVYGPGNVELHLIATQWNEGTVTYNTRPPFSPSGFSFPVETSDIGGPVTIDITSIAQSWVSNPASNQGLALVMPSGKVKFASRESGLGAIMNVVTDGIPPIITEGVTISSVIVDLDASPARLYITGQNFDNGSTPIISLGEFGDLVLASAASADLIDAFLPAGAINGDYLLTLSTGNNTGQSVVYNLTIGAVGPEGPAGEQGIQGLKGDDGTPGVNGEDGAPGVQGIQGIQGIQGPIGETGPEGPAGSTYTGTEPVVVNNVNNVIGLNPATSSGDLLTWNGTNWIAQQPSNQTAGLDKMQPFLGVNYIIALTGLFPSRNSIAEPTLGEISMFGGNFAPRGWAFCDGQLLAISSYQALFSILGTTYGGDGRTTFALPDLRGRVAIHAGTGAGPGLTTRQLGAEGGSETH